MINLFLTFFSRSEPWNSVRVLRVISSAPQYYHSVRIDQRQHRAIHVLPEKYQFCSIGSVGRFNSPENITTEQSQTVTGFGRCRAKVHYGLCTDFDVFVVNQSEESPPISNTTNRLQQQQQQQQKQKSSQRPTQLDFNPIDWNQRFVYSDKTPSIQQSYSSTTTTTINRSISNGSIQQSSLSSSPIIDQFGSIVARIESYRENIGAALELLTTDLDEEPAHLENLIRLVCFFISSILNTCLHIAHIQEGNGNYN